MAKPEALHVVFFPLLAHGHMIPLFDVARLFASRGARATLITTPSNAAALSNKSSDVALEIIPFPSEQVGLPAGIENFDNINGDHQMLRQFVQGIDLLEAPLQRALERLTPRPRCLVSDLYLPWTADVAERVGIPRMTFHGSSYFGMSVTEALTRQRPFEGVESEDEEFVVPGLPGEVRLTTSRMDVEDKTSMFRMMEKAFEAERKSFGVIMNSFEELEPVYATYYRTGRRAWSIGPVSLCNRKIEDKSSRGMKASIDEHECLKWLDSKPPNSVIYVCFGSMVSMSVEQLHQIAMALESSNQNFIWVVKRLKDPNWVNGNDPTKEDEAGLPSGFEARIKGRGLVIRGWAPQVMILDHVATGSFLTHCGWNSTLEGISAGVNMVTWPLFAEQFINEKLITEVLRIGVPVGSKKYFDRVVEGVSVGREAVEGAIRRAMVGKEAEETRERAAQLKKMTQKVVGEGGSSYEELNDLLEELRSIRASNENM